VSPLVTAFVVGAVVAAVSGPVGVFMVARGQSFAGHALADAGTTGGAAGYLAGVNVLYGFVAFNLVAAAAMEALGGRRAIARDVATGVVLGASLALTALFLHIETSTATTGATVTVLFGSLFSLAPGTVPVVAALGAVSLALSALLYRPLLLSAVHPDLARARGVHPALVGAGYLAALSLAVSLSAVTIGAILSTALLVGPAAAALHLVRRPAAAMALASLAALACTLGGVGLAYASYHWPPAGRGWPVSFFVVASVLLVYGASLAARRR